MWGDRIEWLEERAKSGANTPALNNRPILLTGLDFYFKAFNDLSYDRPIGMVAGPIPWSSIIKWCQLNHIHDINEIDTFIRYIRAMEQVPDPEPNKDKKVVK